MNWSNSSTALKLLHSDTIVMQLCAHANDFGILGIAEVQCIPNNSPFRREPTKGHLNTNPQLRQIEIVRPIVLSIIFGSTERNQNPTTQRIRIVSKDEILFRQCLLPFEQAATLVEGSNTIHLSRSSNCHVKEQKIGITHGLYI